MLAVLLVSAVSLSQNSQTNRKANDSVKVSIKDLDRASFKMIEGKQAKEKLYYITGALSACDSIVKQQKEKYSLQEMNSAALRQQNENLTKIVEDVKIIAKNEKSAGLRRGFFGFLKGVGVGVLLTSAFFLIN
jgi:hypothetical protein